MQNAKLAELRQKHAALIYQSSNWKKSGSDLELQANFLLEPDIQFEAKSRISGIPAAVLADVSTETLDKISFQFGLAEMISYWKAACPAVLKIEAGSLTPDQTSWWKTLLLAGLGEFFARNEIEFTADDFVTLQAKTPQDQAPIFSAPLDDKKVLLPMGGGKDSAVSLSLLQDSRYEITPFAINPIQATLDQLKTAQDVNSPVLVTRMIDRTLLELNNHGYFNGHTPFSSVVAIQSTLLAALLGIKAIPLSNESSANEATGKYLGKEVNHQYSKSSQFEKSFQEYATTTIHPEIEYFSLLRPLNELQIASIFSQEDRYFNQFLSCNIGHKTGEWCHSCAKCLFAYCILVPFLGVEFVASEIFSHDLFADEALIEIAEQLVHPEKLKPWDCVGTREESLVGMYLSSKWYQKQDQPLPLVLKHIKESSFPDETELKRLAQKILSAWDDQRLLPDSFLDLVKSAHARVPKLEELDV